LEQGLQEDFLVAVELGATSREQLTDAQLEYVDKIKEKLVKVRLHTHFQVFQQQIIPTTTIHV
jgi:ribosomal protein L16/L10AE